MTKKGGQGHSELGDNFTVSQSQKTAGQLQALENAVDIKVTYKPNNSVVIVTFIVLYFDKSLELN